MNGNFLRMTRRGHEFRGRLALAIGLTSWAATAPAATYVVDTTAAGAGINACTAAANDCSFEGAISKAASFGDTIQFAVASAAGSASYVGIAKSLTIEANNAQLPAIAVSTSLPVVLTVVVKNARWSNLSQFQIGGALYVQQNHLVTIQDSYFGNNQTNSSGGQNPQGGAIYNDGNLTVLRCTIEGNYAPAGGSGIHNATAGTLTVADSLFNGNGIVVSGGSVIKRGFFGAIVSTGTATISNSLFVGNDSQYGAGLQSSGTLRIYNSTFVNNITRAGTESGALLIAGPTVMLNDTVVGNSGVTSGGIYVYPQSQVPTAQLRIGNSLLADNTGAAPNVSGTIVSLDNNLIRDLTGLTVTGNSSHNLYNLDPKLLPLAYNGGGSSTLALAPGSPAIDAGSSCVLSVNSCDGSSPTQALATDQRGTGFARQRGAKVDIGAYEAGVITVQNTNDSGTGSLRQAIVDAQPYDTVVFSGSVFDVPRTITLASTLVVNKTFSIRGPGSGLLTLDGNNAVRHLNVDSPGALTLSGMRISRGNSGNGVSAGLILVNLGTLTGDDLILDNGRTTNLGGCLYNNGTTVLSHLLIASCQAQSGAGIFNESGRSLTISDARIDGSTASSVGAGLFNAGGATLRRVSFFADAAASGGAIYNTGALSATSVTLSGNSASTSLGGGLYQGATGSTSLTASTITANTSTSFGGGGVYNDGGTVTLAGTLIADNSGANGQPDAVGVLRSAGYNLIGSTAGNSFAAGSPSLAGNLVNVAAKLSPLADNGGYARTHAPLFDSPILDAAGATAATDDARGYGRPIDFDTVANAAGGDGRDIGSYELQVATPTAIVASPRNGALSVAFDGGAHGGLAPTSFLVRCGAQSASGSGSPIVVSGLANGTAVSCTVTASAGNIGGIASAPSAAVAPGQPPGAPTIGTVTPANGQASVAFTAPASDGGSPITGYTATCGGVSVTGTASPISVNGLANQFGVTCSVLARNAIGPGPSSGASPSVTPGLPGFSAYIPRVSLGSAAVFNLVDGSLAGNIGLPSGNTGVAVSPDGARVYLANQGSNQVTVINTQNNSVIAQITVGNAPWSAAVSPDSRRVYVTNSGDSSVSVINALTNTVIVTVPVFNHPYGIAVSADGTKVYVTNSGTNAISVIDTLTLTTSGPFTAAMDPIGVATSPDGRRVYVTSQTQNVVAVLDSATNAVVASIPVGSTPYGVVVGRDSQRVYVANAAGNSVSVIDANSNAVVATVPVGARPEGIDVSPDGTRVYVVDRDSSDVRTIDTATNTVVATYSVGAGSNPFAMGRFVAVGGVASTFVATRMPDAPYGQPYLQPLPVSGNPRPSLSLVAGSLPPGLSLDPVTGTIGGTATVIGDYSFDIRAANGVGNTAVQSIQLSVVATRPGPPAITGITPGNGLVSLGLQAPSSNGGSALLSYNVSCVGAAAVVNTTSTSVMVPVPNGLPTSCQATALNAVGESDASASSATVIPGVAPSITSAATASAVYGQPFTFAVTATGAPAPTVTVSSGALPPGLDFVNGVITGTPTAVLSAPIVFHAANPVGGVDQAFELLVQPGLPSAPTQINARSGNGSATLSFVAPTSSGGVAILGYTARCMPGAITASATITTIVVPLSNGSIYDCTVHASNRAGDSPESGSIRVLPRAVDTTDLAIAISNGTASVIGGLPTTYVITVDNTGAAGVVGARVQDALGSDFSDAHWTCQVRDGADCPASGNGELDTQVDLPPGSGVRFELTATVGALPETPVSTVAAVTGPADVTESNLVNNVASDGPDLRGLFKDGYE